ncbi:hypothetical protein WMY93_013395 [Mugilogobius chulae]|uniref:Uncharacterized protein n=1 Tax=Mugilogobius chulae TaxID=88201 RepID=A0AAW0P5Y0_9GOBI
MPMKSPADASSDLTQLRAHRRRKNTQHNTTEQNRTEQYYTRFRLVQVALCTMKTLMVFDFDHTVVDDNSDTWVIRCLPGETLPDSVKKTYRKGHWTEFMGNVMKYLGEQNVTPDQIRSVMGPSLSQME